MSHDAYETRTHPRTGATDAPAPAPVRRRVAWAVALFMLCAPLTSPARADLAGQGRLRLVVKDRDAMRETPVRVRILDEKGEARLPEGAVEYPGQCSGEPEPPVPTGAEGKAPVRFIPSVLGGPSEFYLLAPMTVDLPAGEYRVRASKGPEYTVAEATVRIEEDATEDLELFMERWARMDERGGWYSSDEHLHIPRRHEPGSEADVELGLLMEAEGLDVANLLQMGAFSGVVASHQSRFGQASVFRAGKTLIASAQENPRTWLLGHGVILGASEYVDFPDSYMVYGPYWKQARKSGGVSGIAHWSAPAFFRDALRGQISFLEVLQISVANYSALYTAWDLGLRVAPTAGTDYPCGIASPPGGERFYTRVEGEFSYESWLDGLRRGRTFVTNGPLLRLSVDGVRPGDALIVEPGTSVTVEAIARFDPERDAVATLELIMNGEVVESEEPRPGAREVRIAAEIPIHEASWIAARSTGTKPGLPPMGGQPRSSSAHTSAVHLGLAGGAEARFDPDAAGEVLDLLRKSVDRVGELSGKTLPSKLVGADGATLARDQPAIVEEFDEAVERLEKRARSESGIPRRSGGGTVP